MAIDLDALRLKHEQLTNPTAGSNTDFLQKFYQIPEGSNAVRILPWKDDEKEFYAETKIHRIPQPNNTVKNVHCRRMQGEKCPLCDLYFDLWKPERGYGRKEDEALARQIKPRSRYYMNVMDRESGDVKILSMKIIAAMLDEDFGDITDPENGHDFKIVKIMEDQWPKYDQSQPRPKASPLGSNKEIAEVMGSLHDIHDLVKLEEYEDVKKSADTLRGVPAQGSSTPQEQTEVSDNDYLSQLQN